MRDIHCFGLISELLGCFTFSDSLYCAILTDLVEFRDLFDLPLQPTFWLLRMGLCENLMK